jgi:very-short-patch-repair endonuclease
MSLIGNQNYLPPYESPLEDSFALTLDKYLADKVGIAKQVEVQTFCGRYRLDFVASADGDRSVALECDGEDYHDQDRDEWRDALILDATNLRAIYRFQGPALFYHIEDCLYLLARWERHVFSDRARTNLARLASESAIRAADQISFTGVMLIYPNKESFSGPFVTRIERHVIEAPPGSRSFLKAILEYAKRSGLTDLDEIRTRHLQRPES